MHNSQDLQKVLEIRDAILGGNEKRSREQREAGKLTARERVEKLADAGSFVELFALVSQNEEGAGVITDMPHTRSRVVYLFAQDFTVHGGAMARPRLPKSSSSWTWPSRPARPWWRCWTAPACASTKAPPP